MGMLICPRCEKFKDSKDGDTVEDPTDSCQMCCIDCLTEDEAAEIEEMEASRSQAMRDKVSRTPEYVHWEENQK